MQNILHILYANYFLLMITCLLHCSLIVLDMACGNVLIWLMSFHFMYRFCIDGQKTAVRLTKKLQMNSKQLQALSDELKAKGVHFTVAQLADPESSVYDQNLPHLNKDQIHAANCIAELCWAQEEEGIIQDVNLFQQWLVNQNMFLGQLYTLAARNDKALQYLRCKQT